MNFSVIKRNYGHWDICSDKGRLFRIRGTPGKFCVLDERAAPYPRTEFKTVTACMVFITDELMHENIVEDPLGDGNNLPHEGRAGR